MTLRWIFLLLAGAWAVPLAAQPTPLPRAHAHNDYEHERPLHDALAHGFGSVEADIHLVDGALLVAHDREDVQAENTLQRLYLDPLQDHIQQHGGRVYADAPPLLLLIDIKSDAEATYLSLRDVLREYTDLLTRFAHTTVEEGAVTIVISGNRPRALMEAEPERWAAYDGRLDDLLLDPSPSPAFIPLVSSNWNTVTTWQGDGPMPEEAQQRLADIVTQAHEQGRILRFWATPDTPAMWQTLYNAGVDLLNADDLDGLQTFLLNQLD